MTNEAYNIIKNLLMLAVVIGLFFLILATGEIYKNESEIILKQKILREKLNKEIEWLEVENQLLEESIEEQKKEIIRIRNL